MGGRHPKAYLEQSESIYKPDVPELVLCFKIWVVTRTSLSCMNKHRVNSKRLSGGW